MLTNILILIMLQIKQCIAQLGEMAVDLLNVLSSWVLGIIFINNLD